MKNFNQLKQQITAAIYDNGQGLISGSVLQEKLLAIVSKMEISTFEGIATAATQPTTDKLGEHFYIAKTAGTYSNFDGHQVGANEVVMFCKDTGETTWSHVVLYTPHVAVDKTPTSGSTNAVQSGGVKSYVDGQITGCATASQVTQLSTQVSELGDTLVKKQVVSDNIFNPNTDVLSFTFKDSTHTLVSNASSAMMLVATNVKSGDNITAKCFLEDFATQYSTLGVEDISCILTNVPASADSAWVKRGYSVMGTRSGGYVQVDASYQYAYVHIKFNSASNKNANLQNMLNKLYVKVASSIIWPTTFVEYEVESIDKFIAKEQGVASSGKYLKVGEDGNVTPSEISQLETFVEKSQGVGNAGKFLKVGADGNVTLGVGGGGEVTTDGVVALEQPKTIYLGQDLLSGVVGGGTGWTHSNGTYTHASGNSAQLEFSYPTTNGSVYIVSFRTNISELSEGDVCVSVGSQPKCDIYNGTTGPFYIGVIGDGGNLKFSVVSSRSIAISQVYLRQIVESSDTSIVINGKCVTAGTTSNNVTGWWNVAIGGDDAMQSNINGSRNVAIGIHSMSALKSGERNIGIGTFALNQLTYGKRNIAIGADALYRVANADGNVAIGKGAAGYTYSNPSSSVLNGNVAVGDHALCGNSENYSNNVAIGKEAMAYAFSTSAKSGNVAIGYQAGYKGTSNNISIGYQSGYWNQGNNNIMLGYFCGQGVSNGNNNTFVGSSITASANVSNTIVIGANAVASKSNQVVIGTTSQTEVVLLGNKKIIFNNDGSVTWETLT